MNRTHHTRHSEAGLTILETIVALVILGLGMVVALNLFPIGVATSVRVEKTTRAKNLAEMILEGFRADPAYFYVIPSVTATSALNIIPLPGNAFDDDGDYDSGISDLNRNGQQDADFDGSSEPFQFLFDGIDNDFDGVTDDNGDGFFTALPGNFNLMDGDIYFDPEPSIDEEYCDNIDNDGDGFTDEDCRLATMIWDGAMGAVVANPLILDPLAPGDGLDEDGDGEPGGRMKQVIDQNRIARTIAVADGIDNNNDGRIDEGIDEEIYDGQDNDGDGMIDEDTKLAAYPFVPVPFPAPNEDFSYQIAVGRVPDNGGNGVDDDYDTLTDEEVLNGLDDELDGRTDEDCRVAPLRGFRLVTVRIFWGGDREDNDSDGRTDEEAPDGIDDDGDLIGDDINSGNKDTIDTWNNKYELTGAVELRVKV